MDIVGRSLAELTDDPLTGLVMKSDGSTAANLSFCLSRSRASDCWRPGLGS